MGPIYEGAPNLLQTQGGVFPEPRNVTEKGRVIHRLQINRDPASEEPPHTTISCVFYPKKLAIAVLGFH